MESVAVLDQDIKRAFSNKESVVSVFFDIEKAYDSLWKEGLMIKMFDLGVTGRIFNWIRDFLMNRTIQVMVGGVGSKTVEIENGTPQGSVTSPVLFNIMINDIFGKVEGAFGLSLFADVGAIWKRGRNVEFILKQIQRALVSVEEWGNTWGFKISASKSKYIVFGFKRKLPNIGLYMNELPLEKVKAFKFLGVWFEERMTWAVHVSKILLKCEKVLNVMRSLAGCEWGAMIRSSLDYGCFVYGSASKSILARLDVLQARALRLCCGAFRTSPVTALLIEMGEMPLWLRRIKLGLQYWVKLRGCPQTFQARCLLHESDGGNKYKTFFGNINQWAGRLGLEQVSVAEHTSCLPIPYRLLPELNIDLAFLQEKD